MLRAFGATDVGRVRANNEDTFIAAPELGLFLVADGMGGAAAGETASQIAAETMREIVEQEGPDGMNPAKMITACHEVNRRIRTTAVADTRLSGMGTTLVAAAERGRDLLLVSVGDSRAYLYENGVLTQVTQDQSWVNEIGRKLGLSEQALGTHPMRHVLTMALGISGDLRINNYVLNLADGATLLLCSDGLHGPLAEAEIAAVFGDGGSLEDRGRALIDAALEHGGPDNVSVVLLER
jgi:PPM family protein phosphatase